jgi:hypothetical protein
MNTRERIEKRFKELEIDLDAVSKTVESHLRTPNRPGTSWVTERSVSSPKIETIDTTKWFSWCTRAMHLLKLIFGESSIHLTEFHAFDFVLATDHKGERKQFSGKY